MADFAKHKKDDLVKLLKKLDVHTVTKDTKKVLIEKIEKYISSHADSEHKVHAAFQEILDESDEEEEEEVKQTVSVTKKEEEDEDDEDDEDDDDEDDDEEEDDDDEDDEEEDADYKQGPPIDVKELVLDPIIKYSELAYSKVLEFTDSVGITYLEYSDELREKLSTTVTLSFLELLAELFYFLYAFVPLVALKHNSLNHQLLKDNIEFFSTSTIPTPELSVLLEHDVIVTFLQWALNAIIFPLIISYYINFSRRVVAIDEDEGFLDRIYKYDPFIFAILKVLIHYFFNVNAGLLAPAVLLSGVWNSVKYYVLVQLGVYGQFTQALGSFPVILGLANVAIALYAQFENY